MGHWKAGKKFRVSERCPTTTTKREMRKPVVLDREAGVGSPSQKDTKKSEGVLRVQGDVEIWLMKPS